MEILTSNYHQHLANSSRFPRLTDEEVQALFQSIVMARQYCDDALETQGKHRLVEAFLPLIIVLAKRYVVRYRSFHMLDVADFVQEGSLALFQALDTIHFTTVTSLRSYSSAIIRSSFKRVHYGSDDLMCLPHSSYYRVKKQGTLDHYRFFTSSLDVPLYEGESESDTLIDRLAAPPVIVSSQDDSTFCCPRLLQSLGVQQPETKTTVVEQLLTTLPPRQEQVLRLRYGFDATDGRAYTQEEVARLLGLSRNTINATEQCALKNLRTRKLSFGRRWTPSLALKGNKNACHRTDAGRQKIERQRHEREERLRTAYHQLQAQGLPVTRDALSRAAHADNRTVADFLRLHPSEEHSSQMATDVEERLMDAYTALESSGETLTIKRLSHLAQVSKTKARTHLCSRGIQVFRGRPKKSKQEGEVEGMFNVVSPAEAS